MTIEERLSAIANGPKPFVVVTRYQDGAERRFPCHSHAAASNYRDMQARKVGRQLINRETGAKVCVASVDIEVEG